MTEYAVDYSWARPDPHALKAAGINYACRYLSHDKTGKTLTKAEAFTLLAAGVGIPLNFEDRKDRALQGYDAGVADGSFANALANDLGAPADVPILYSVDIDPGSPVNWQILSYFEGLRKVGGRPADCYGGAVLLRTLRSKGLIPPAPSGWNANATSWNHGPTDPDACLLQLTSHPTNIAGFTPNQYDVSIVQHAPHCWGGSGSVDDMNPAQEAVLQGIQNDLHDPDHGVFRYLGDLVSLVKAIPHVGPTSAVIDYAALAKAVNDDAAKRLAS